MSHKQHMNKRYLQCEVDDGLQDCISIKQKNPYLRNPSFAFTDRILYKMQYRNRH